MRTRPGLGPIPAATPGRGSSSVPPCVAMHSKDLLVEVDGCGHDNVVVVGPFQPVIAAGRELFAEGCIRTQPLDRLSELRDIALRKDEPGIVDHLGYRT